MDLDLSLEGSDLEMTHGRFCLRMRNVGYDEHIRDMRVHL